MTNHMNVTTYISIANNNNFNKSKDSIFLNNSKRASLNPYEDNIENIKTKLGKIIYLY